MIIMKTFYTLCLVTMLFNLVSSCEKQTQYEKGGRCCQKCGPGKRMLVNDDCDDPRCQDCLEGEFQSEYTDEIKCTSQPSCDINLNFRPQVIPTPKDILSQCICKLGYYCTADDDCSTCRPHTVCKAGQKIVKHGSHVGNTVCQTCKNGTFSISDSSDTCKEWTTCEPGYVEKTPGSLTSDRICEKGTPSERGVVLAAVLGVLFVLVLAGIAAYFLKKRTFKWKQIQKEAVEGTRINLHQEHVPIVDEDERYNQQPEEDVDHSVPVSPTSNVTENGNVVEQENGKHSICPSTETQQFFLKSAPSLL